MPKNARHVQAKPRALHRRLNNTLTVVAIMLGLYIGVSPFVPQVGWWLRHRHASPATQVASTPKPASHTNQAPIPADNLLIIPRLTMHEVIHDGPTLAELRKGVWLIPSSSPPGQQSNTVIIGHRFTYAGPAVFYFLDKIQLGDAITIDWHQKEYTYKVTDINVVPPTDLSVEQPTTKPQLTLYTCTPLWTAKNRLVITAPLQG